MAFLGHKSSFWFRNPQRTGLGQMPNLLFMEADPHKSTSADLLVNIHDIQGVMGWIVLLQSSYVGVLTPRTSACALVWKQGLCRGDQVKMGH